MSAQAPADWATVKLGDIGDALIGLTYQPSSVRPFGTLVLRSSNVQDNELSFEDNVYVDSAIPERIRVRYGDILICVRNGSRTLIGKSARLDERVVGETFGAFMAVFRSQANEYLHYYFQSDAFKQQVDQHLGATINQITNASLKSFTVTLPPLDERARIVGQLRDATALVSALQCLLAKKEDIREGIAQDLFAARVRLPGFSSPWTEIRLGDVGSTYSGLAGKSKADFGSGSSRYVTFVDVINSARVRGDVLEPVVVGSSERQNQVVRGDLLFNGSSETPEEVALGAAVDFDPEPGTYLNSFCFGYRIARRHLVDPMYLAFMTRSHIGRRLVFSLAQGATRYNISKRQFLNLAPAFPPIEEQQAITAVLTDADTEIAASKKHLAKAKAIKEGMAQQLLAGRVRLPNPEPVA